MNIYLPALRGIAGKYCLDGISEHTYRPGFMHDEVNGIRHPSGGKFEYEKDRRPRMA